MYCVLLSNAAAEYGFGGGKRAERGERGAKSSNEISQKIHVRADPHAFANHSISNTSCARFQLFKTVLIFI